MSMYSPSYIVLAGITDHSSMLRRRTVVSLDYFCADLEPYPTCLSGRNYGIIARIHHTLVVTDAILQDTGMGRVRGIDIGIVLIRK